MPSSDQDSGDGTGWSPGPVREWFLLNGHRLYVTGLVLAVLFVALTTVIRSGFAPLRAMDPLFYVFSGLLSGNLTVVTVVVAINQLLLSREFYTPDELRSEMQGVADYRSDVGDALDEVPPVHPSEFLCDLVERTARTAEALDSLAAAEASGEAATDLDSITTEVIDHAESVADLIDQSNASTFEGLSATLTTDYARHVHGLRRVRARHGDQLGDGVDDCIDDVVARLEDIDVARQYFKTIYLQKELATLSQFLFYVGIAALLVVVSGLLMLTAADGASVSRPYLDVAIAGAITAGLAPISLLFAFLLRISTVTRRTAAILPFTTD